MSHLQTAPATTAAAHAAAMQRALDSQTARANKIAAREPGVIPRHRLVTVLEALETIAAVDKRLDMHEAAAATETAIARLRAIL